MSTEGLTDNLATKFTYLIPAGLEIASWRVSLGVGQYGASTALTALGIALLIARRLRHPV